MALYYTVRVYTDNPRIAHSCLISNNTASNPWGTTHATGPAQRFLWKEEADEALRVFLAGKSQPIYTHGRVFHVTEDPAGPDVSVDAAQKLTPVPSPSVKPDTSPKTLDLSSGEALANHQDYGRSAEIDEPLCEWLHENAKALLQAARGYERLDWLRQHPESCRAMHDCKNPRQPGWILCAVCAGQGVGGYADVYQAHYTQKFNAILEELDTKIRAALGVGKTFGDETTSR